MTNQKVEDSQLEKWPGKNLEDLTNSTSIEKDNKETTDGKFKKKY